MIEDFGLRTLKVPIPWGFSELFVSSRYCPKPKDVEIEHSYTSLSEAITDLQEQGFSENLNFCTEGLENKRKACVYPASELAVVHFYRFEGFTDPADNSILYAIETSDGHKGLLVDAYGAYSGNIPLEIIQKLKIVR